jgi:hypothetical protein
MNLTQDMIDELGTITTRNEQGQHFTAYSEHWETLEEDGLIQVTRPVHPATGIPYGQETWTVEVTEQAQEMLAAEVSP